MHAMLSQRLIIDLIQSQFRVLASPLCCSCAELKMLGIEGVAGLVQPALLNLEAVILPVRM